MSISIQTNRKTKEVEIIIDGTIAKTLKGQEALHFLTNSEKQGKENAYLFQNFKKITIEDIEESGCPINELTGLDFDITVYHQHFPHFYIGVDFLRNGNKLWANYSLADNFSEEQIHFGPITNHQLRACLSDELIEYIWDVPNFEITVGNTNDFFNENKTVYYSADVSSDT